MSVPAPVQNLRFGAPPRRVLVWPYLVHHWAIQSIMPIMRERYQTAFFIICSEASMADRYRPFLGPKDQIVLLPARKDVLAQDDLDPGLVIREAQENEAKYGINFIRDVIQLDRSLFTSASGIAPNSIFGKAKMPPMDRVAYAINFYLRWFEELFDRLEIDLFVGWAAAMEDACCTYVTLRRGLLATHSYGAKVENRVFWASGPFISDFQHREALNLVKDAPEFDVADLRSPDGATKNIGKQISDLYSTRRVLIDFARAAFERAHHWLNDVRKRRNPLRARRVSLLQVLAIRAKSWLFFREFEKICTNDMSKICERPFVFFAFHQEPEFTTQAQSKDFNDQQAIIRQIAKSLPIGINLVIKEHTILGYKPASYYKELVAFPNVIMAHPNIAGPELVKHSMAVASLRGTVTLEAALCGKPALNFVRDTEFAPLPNVRYVGSLADLGDILREITQPIPDHQSKYYRREAAKFREAIRQISFPADSINSLDGTLLDRVTAERATDLLVRLNTMFHQKLKPVGPAEPGNNRASMPIKAVTP